MVVESVIVKMTRSEKLTNWGFRLQGGKEFGQALAISKITEGSLADRAGLKEGDRLVEISGRKADNLAHSEAQQTILNSGNNLDLVVNRNVSTIWSPAFPFNGQGAPVSTTSAVGQGSDYSSSLSRDYSKKTTSYRSTTQGGEFQPQPITMTTSYSTPAPFSAPSPGGSQYSYSKKTTLYERTRSPVPVQQQQQPPAQLSPVVPPVSRPKSPAVAYLEKTGGLFGMEPKGVVTATEEPSYLKSATLKLIKEEQRGQSTPGRQSPIPRVIEPSSAQQETGVPVCENCGQRIIGVFCKAGGKALHAECFNCSTCGTSLKNVGYFLVNDKFYCELHAKQHDQFGGRPPVDPNVFASYGGPPPQRSPRSYEPVKAPYHTEIPKPGTGTKQFSPSFNSQSTFTSTQTAQNFASGPLIAPKAYSPAPFGQQKGAPRDTRLTAPAGDGIQMFGPKTPNRGRGILKQLQEGPRVPVCESCHREIRGPFVLALGKSWCPDHFLCSTPSCRRQLLEVGFIEQNGAVHCEYCFEKFFAPKCSKCQSSITGDCLTALQRQWHPECFTCVQCHKPFGNASFFLENGQPYCENDWNSLFTTKCNSCQFPIEAGDRWVEALGNSYHSDCFCCTVCQKTLEGQSFYAKAGRPYCKTHA